jgi:hypothetical protein
MTVELKVGFPVDDIDPALTCRPRHRHQPPPVAYATDLKRHLSPTPTTPIGAVNGVADMIETLSMA